MSLMVRPDSGTKSRAANQQDVNKHINALQDELAKSRAEAQKAKDKLTCLISLIRRSWNGDRNASIHLANIIGLDIPPGLLGSGTDGRPASRVYPAASTKTPAEVNWERLALKLLQRDYENMQHEIRQHQQRYIENRSRFMDEVMHFHMQDMARTPLSRPSSAHKLHSVDQQFLQVHSVVMPDGTNTKRPALNRPKTSVLRARPKVERDRVQQAEVKLRDLFVEASSPRTASFASPAADASLAGNPQEAEAVRQQRRPRVRQDYSDTKRYVQGNLFRVEDMISKKPRPMSAAMLRERDSMRARPKSAVTFNLDTTGGDANRPLKYETTRPVPGKRASSAKARLSSTGETPQHLNMGVNGEPAQQHNMGVSDEEMVNPNVSPIPEYVLPPHAFEEPEDLGEPAAERAPISVRVKNAITRPESVDRFSQDLRSMEEMEAAFKMNTLALQKKLGIPEDGIV